jgi:chromosome partitioning protein
MHKLNKEPHMKIIACLNEKGGTGKSTLATNIATALHRSGKKVVLLDADPQGTARDWRAASPEDADLPPVLAADRPPLLTSSLSGLSADYAIIDAPAKAESMSAAIVKIANVALLVIQPSGADVWASGAAVKLIQAKHEIGGQINAAFLVNRASGSTKLSKLIKDGSWNEYDGIDQLEAVVGNRAVFARAMTDGVSVYDMNDSKAKFEIDLIIEELEAAEWL